jgi:hypothetical protein
MRNELHVPIGEKLNDRPFAELNDRGLYVCNVGGLRLEQLVSHGCFIDDVDLALTSDDIE